jgi:demethylmenaquinone methyltransferase/2-methoxy-6-polyprenyl-1,4-benzoquinol methylase
VTGDSRGKPVDRHFDRIADLYNESLPSHVVAHYLRRRVRLLESLLPPPGPILDVGCGTGLLLWGLAEAGYEVTGLDTSIGMLRQAPLIPNLTLIQGSADALPVLDGAFPAVISVATLHHLVDPKVVAATVREMLRVTALGGVMVVWDHNPRNPYWPLLMARVPQDQEPTRLVPRDEVLSALQGQPTGDVRCSYSGWIPEFAPRWAIPTLTVVERVLEAVPGIRSFSAHNIIVARKL